MYAVIATGGKQYRITEGQELMVEKLPGVTGDRIVFDQVLMVGAGADSRIGTPVIEKATVEAEITSQGRGRKIVVFKFKRRKKYRRKAGHRQPFTKLRITGINA